MKFLLLAILLFSSTSFGVTTPHLIPTTCYAHRQLTLVASTVSVLVASSSSDINCWLIQNKDAAISVYGGLNASTTSGFEIPPDSIYQMYTNPFSFLYLRSGSSTVNVDIISGRTTPQ